MTTMEQTQLDRNRLTVPHQTAPKMGLRSDKPKPILTFLLLPLRG
jgi:hypothetical protein